MRHHYMTLCTMNNTVVTHMFVNGYLEITFEQPINNGFKTLVLRQDNVIISNDGFNNDEVSIFRNFMINNLAVMIEEAKGEL